MKASNRWLIGIAAGTIALIIVAVVLALAGSGTTHYAEGTPESTVQRFLEALRNEEAQAAYGYLARSVQSGCRYEDLRSRVGEVRSQLEEARVTLDKTRINDDRAEVLVNISGFRGPRGPVIPPPPVPFDYEDSFSYTFLLQKEDGQWRLSQISWPFWWCPTPSPTKVPASTY